MHKIIFILLFTVLGALPSQSFAQTASPSAKPDISSSPTSIGDSTQIEKIKDLVASRVAELKLVEKRGVLGTVTTASSTQITLTDIHNKKRVIDIDEITKFTNPGSSTFGISDIKPGNTLGIVGLLNKGTDHILARFVNTVTTVPTLFEGVVTNIDRPNFTITVTNEDGKNIDVDIATSTKISSFTKSDSLVKSGFSKIMVGERMYASGFMDDTKENLLNAGRVIHFPELPLSAKLKRFAESEVAASPTAGLSATLTPRPTTAD